MTLHDGEQKVASITVMMLARNNRVYLEWFLPMMETMEKTYPDTIFKYAFYENDSKDTTARLLEKFVSHPKRKKHSILISEKLQYAPEAFAEADSFDRIKYLASLRNKFLNKLRPLDSDWTWLLDTDIYFDKSVLANMFASEPKKNDIAYLSCYTKHVKRLENGSGYMTCNHYYDTYSIINTDDRSVYPICQFSDCTSCARRRALAKVPMYDPKQDVVDVRSAFAGCVLLPTIYLNKPFVEWRPTDVCFAGMAICEHVYFCDMIRVASDGGRIVILQNVKDLYWRK